MTLESTSSRKSAGILYGLINGGAGIAFTVILYLGGAKMFVSPIAWLGILIPITVAVIGGLQYRKQCGGHLEFTDALKLTFMILVIGAFLATVFQHVLFNYIDTPFRQALNQASAEKVESMMRRMGASEEQIDKATEETLSTNNYTIARLLLVFAIGCILWFIVALIISAIIKRKAEPFENSFNS